jgi:hypothetical protein
MPEQSQTLKVFGPLCLLGTGFSSFVFFAPDPGPHLGSFFTIAAQSTWGSLFEMTAAWCSVKIILFSLGLILALDSLGIIFLRHRREELFWCSFLLQCLTCCGLMAGGFYLVKALF